MKTIVLFLMLIIFYDPVYSQEEAIVDLAADKDSIAKDLRKNVFYANLGGQGILGSVSY